MESNDSQITYIGYSKHDDYVWTVEFELDKPIQNTIINFFYE